MQRVRPAAVAGMFYPGRREQLAADVAGLLEGAQGRLEPTWSDAKAWILPHAGYVYSGSTAALGYASLAARRDEITRVVLLGPTHRVACDGLALPEADAMATPLGLVRVAPVDAQLREAMPQLVDRRDVHAQEHALEVQLPFLQSILREIEVVPLAVGRADPEAVAEVIDALWGGPETVVIVSSDLSHYLPYAAARAADDATLEQVLALDGPLTHEQACGATPINGLLVAARRRGMTPTLLGACNSGDTAGDKERVVGYAAVALAESATG
ncbi:MAG: AmmeMemoRadiSam system protein B [Tetrasphaera sp.]